MEKVEGTKTIKLKVNKTTHHPANYEIKQTQNVTLGSEESTSISFTLTRKYQGGYDIRIGSLHKILVVHDSWQGVKIKVKGTGEGGELVNLPFHGTTSEFQGTVKGLTPETYFWSECFVEGETVFASFQKDTEGGRLHVEIIKEDLRELRGETVAYETTTAPYGVVTVSYYYPE